MDPRGEEVVSWHLRRTADLHWRRWGDEWAIFDVSSGQTHQMDFVTGVALLQFDDGLIATPDELFEQVAGALDVERSVELRHALAASLESLSMADLIELGS